MFLFASKWLIMTFTWALALALSLALRFWGDLHPEPFIIRPLVILILLFGPSVVMGLWLAFIGFEKVDSK